MKTLRCPKCKRMYEYDGPAPEHCPECAAREEMDYRQVREYVKNNTGATIDEVSRIFNIPPSKVIQYIREERLEIVHLSQSFLRCMDCGRPIQCGVRCDYCKRRPPVKR